MSELSTALTVIERAQVALLPAANDQQLAALAAASKSIVEITNADGYKQAHSARMALKTQRIAIEKIAKGAREDATAFSKAVIAEEKRLIGLIQPEEQRLEALQSEWDTARAAEKRAREEAERARIAEIQRRLGKLESLVEVYTAAMPPDRLVEVIQQLEAPAQFDYQEFSARATELRQAALVALRSAHVEALEHLEREAQERAAREAEEARKAAERKAEEERLAEVRRRLDEEKAEQERQAAARRAEEERRQAEERERLEAERKEQARLTEIRRWIVALNGPTHLMATDSPMLIEQALNTLRGAVVDERYAELRDEAAETRVAGIQRLTALLDAANAYRIEQDRLAAERAELERRQQEQARREADIERRDREQREAEERQRREAAEAEARRQDEERARREAEEHRAQLRQRVSQLQAWEIVDIVANELGTDGPTVAARIAEIGHEEWVAIALSNTQAAA